MSKKTWITVAAVIVVALAGIIALVILQQTKQNTTTNEPSHNTTEPTTSRPTGGQGAEEPQTGEVVVMIQSFAFSPNNLTIKKGTTVTWTNNDEVQHTVTADDNSSGLDSKLLAKGESYQFTFDEVGSFGYHCKPHPQMTAIVTVVE